MKKLLLLLSLSFGITCLANASELEYECTVNNLYEQTDSGEIKLSGDIWQKIYKGHKFTVSKTTGLISGTKYFDTSQMSDTRVFKGGSSGSSFKAVYYHPDAGRWLILEIQKNSGAEEQPFKTINVIGIATGLCK